MLVSFRDESAPWMGRFFCCYDRISGGADTDTCCRKEAEVERKIYVKREESPKKPEMGPHETWQ